MKVLLALLFVWICLNVQGYFSQDPKIHMCDLLISEEYCVFKNVNPGDQIQMRCAYVKDDFFLRFKDYKTNRLCFTYVHKVGNDEIYLTEDLIRGIYNISESKKGSVIIKSMTLPPFVLHDVVVACSCYKYSYPEREQVRRLLYVELKKNTPRTVVGCDFNKHRESMYGIETLKVVSNYESKPVCDVYVEKDQQLALLCPPTYQVEPKNCFQEIYTYKAIRYIRDQTVSSESVTKTNIRELIGSDIRENVGDTRFRFGLTPQEVEKKVTFMCKCINTDFSELRMNVHLNKNENEVNDLYNKEVPDRNTDNNTNSSKLVKLNISFIIIFVLYESFSILYSF